MTEKINPEPAEINKRQVAIKCWLISSILRKGLLPKQIYLDLGVDKSTFSRWLSLEDSHTPNLEMVLRMVPMLDDQAEDDLVDLIRQAA